MLEALKEAVLEANLSLPRLGLAILTWGNVSGIDRDAGLVVIKPSGVPYAAMRREDLAVLRLADGSRVEGKKPSSDAATHLALYRAFPGAGGVVHTHSRYATAFAQMGKGIPPGGTTHADYFYGEVPCTRSLTPEEIGGDYEAETGKVIIERLTELDLAPEAMPAALVRGHGPFTWGESPEKAVENALVLEEVACIQLLSRAEPISQALLDKHYLRKHGKNAYYGQG